MPSGYKVNGVDLDSIFAALDGSTPGPNTGFKVNGVDLAQRYYASTGGDKISSNTGFKSNGVDLKEFFRDITYVETPVDPPVITGGTVTGGPYNFMVGDVATFTVTATGTGLTYQWHKDGVNISGATSDTYSLGATTHPSQSGVYGVTVTNSGGSVSEYATLTVNDYAPAITGGTITGGPYNFVTGSVAHFTVTATGTNLQYAWFKDGSLLPHTGAEIPAFIAAPSDSGTYKVVVYNSAGSVEEETTLTVTDP